jgi:hypothetical protein
MEQLIVRRKMHTKVKAVLGVLVYIVMLILIASPVIYFLADEWFTPANPIKLLRVKLSTPTLGEIYLQEVNRFDRYATLCGGVI